MGQRRILVIGSQCEALNPLSFLPQTAQELHAVMVDPARGACIPAFEGAGLLLDPTVDAAKDAIRTVYRRAAKDEATLFLVYIGHGERAGDDFYLLPRDAESPPTSDTALHLTNLIKELHQTTPGRVDGLAVIVDACYSGQGGFGAAETWVRKLEGDLRFEVMTATAFNRPAAMGCFSQTLSKLLRDGISEVPSGYLHCHHLRSRIARACPHQVPQHPSFNADEALWLAKNIGSSREPWAHTSLADQIQKLTLGYQVVPTIDEVVARSSRHRLVAIVGAPGSGKSALTAALAWPDAAKGTIPASFLQAVAFLTEATTPHDLARTLTDQLVRSVPGFREAQQALLDETPYSELQRLAILEKKLTRPLSRLSAETEVRIAVDALDRLAIGARDGVLDALNKLVKLPLIRLIITARPETSLPAGASIVTPGPAPAETVAQYLAHRSIAKSRHDEVIGTGNGNWLVVRVLADLLSENPEAATQSGQLVLGEAYDELLDQCGVNGNENTRRVMSVIAASGAGPILPITLLCTASGKLGGPATPASIRDELARLRGLAVRTAAGTEEEHIGLFHQTLVEHILAQAPDDALAAHRALANSIISLISITPAIDLSDPVQRYAFEREPEHLWALGETESTLKCLFTRTAVGPRDNLQRWLPWGLRFENNCGADHPHTLATRYNIAFFMGECGNAGEALHLLEALLPDAIRVLRADHRDTLRIRHNIAAYTGQCGDMQKALRLFEELLPVHTEVLGPMHPDTLTIRNNIALYTSESGDVHKALRLFKALLRDYTRMPCIDHYGRLTIRSNIAALTDRCGDPHKALRLSVPLLPEHILLVGPEHQSTFRVRNNIAMLTGRCGNPREALRLLKELLHDKMRVLNEDHRSTLATRSKIASLTDQCGNRLEALRLFEALLLDQMRALGDDDPDTLSTRESIRVLSQS